MTDYLENGVSEYDVYDRIDNEIALFGAKLWGKGNKDLSAAKEDYGGAWNSSADKLYIRDREKRRRRGSSLSDG